MALSSMTGFARGHGVSSGYAWAREIKSVNAKGLDLRLRLPLGWDAVEPPARAKVGELLALPRGWDPVEPPVRSKVGELLARGTVYANLNIERQGKSPVVRVNDAVLAAVLGTIKSLAGRVDAERPRLDAILAVKGVIEVVD